MIERPHATPFPEAGLICALLVAACAVVAFATFASA